MAIRRKNRNCHIQALPLGPHGGLLRQETATSSLTWNAGAQDIFFLTTFLLVLLFLLYLSI
jgi:hypothetical protein